MQLIPTPELYLRAGQLVPQFDTDELEFQGSTFAYAGFQNRTLRSANSSGSCLQWRNTSPTWNAIIVGIEFSVTNNGITGPVSSVDLYTNAYGRNISSWFSSAQTRYVNSTTHGKQKNTNAYSAVAFGQTTGFFQFLNIVNSGNGSGTYDCDIELTKVIGFAWEDIDGWDVNCNGTEVAAVVGLERFVKTLSVTGNISGSWEYDP